MKTDDKQFKTGARRTKDADHVRYDLITPIGLEALAKTYAEGANKYAPFNWELGMPIHDLLNHSIQHIFRYLGGDRTEDHFAHAAWGLLAAIHSEALWPHLNSPHIRGKGCCLTPANVAEIERQLAENLERRKTATTHKRKRVSA